MPVFWTGLARVRNHGAGVMTSLIKYVLNQMVVFYGNAQWHSLGVNLPQFMSESDLIPVADGES